MIPVVSILAFAALLLLGNALIQRLADRLARIRHDDTLGTAFDAAPVHSRLCGVRQNYVAEAKSHALTSDYHDELIESARHVLVQLSFFQSRRHSIQP